MAFVDGEALLLGLMVVGGVLAFWWLVFWALRRLGSRK